MRTSRRAGAALAIAIALSALSAQAAFATFHEIVFRELYPGSSISPESEYVELQAYSSGQNFVKNHEVSFFNAIGGPIGTAKFGADVSNGANQMTILVATPAAEAEFGVTADLTMAANLLSPAGGGVCWEAFDCVSWGSFSGSLSPSPGSPAAPGGIPDGQALRRTIAPGCASLLEESDDHNNSAADFEAVFPAPRPNSATPTEKACTTASGGSGGGGGNGNGGPPQTFLKGKPAKRTRDRTPTFRFRSSEDGATFQCKLDRKAYRSCRSPFTTKKLTFGKHTFRVRARDRSGEVDASPASFAFTVLKPR
jgi:hypothetical protein